MAMPHNRSRWPRASSSHWQRGAAPSSSANCTTANTTCLGLRVKTAAPTTLEPSRLAHAPSGRRRRCANGWWTTAKANCVHAPGHPRQPGWLVRTQPGPSLPTAARRRPRPTWRAWLGKVYGYNDGWSIVRAGQAFAAQHHRTPRHGASVQRIQMGSPLRPWLNSKPPSNWAKP